MRKSKKMQCCRATKLCIALSAKASTKPKSYLPGSPPPREEDIKPNTTTLELSYLLTHCSGYLAIFFYFPVTFLNHPGLRTFMSTTSSAQKVASSLPYLWPPPYLSRLKLDVTCSGVLGSLSLSPSITYDIVLGEGASKSYNSALISLRDTCHQYL